LRCKLFCGQTLSTALEESGLRQLLGRKSRLRSKLFCRQPELSRSLSLLSRELFRRQPQAASSLSCTKLSFCTLSPQGPGELSRLLGPALLRLKGGLSPLRSGFKTLSPELSRGPRLLLQYIPLKLCFLNPLSRAAKGPGAHCLGPLSLSCDIALATDVRQRLVNDLLLIRAHELRNRGGVVHGRGAGEPRNTLLSRRRSHAACGLELASSFCSDASGARNSLLCLLSGSACRAASA